MAGSILGTRVLRTEDPALLTGSARYLDDLDLPGKLHAVFARSEVAHATLGAVHTEDALAVPGVVAVLTAAELGVAPHHRFAMVHPDFARPPLADGVVRFVGEAIALVVAESVAAAADGAAAVWADYEPLTAITDPEAAFDDEAPVIFPAHGSNQAMVVTDAVPVDLESQSDVVVRGRYVNQRMAVVPMEPNCCAAVPGDDGRMTFYASTQMPHLLRGQLAAALEMEPPSCASSLRRSAAASAARPGCAPSTRPSPPRPATSPDPSRGCRRVATISSRSRTAVARSSTPSSAAGATARSPACACASSVTAARTRASGPSSRPAPSGWPTARTASPPSSSTSSSP